MWQKNQENIILSGQTTCTPKSLQGPHGGNNILPPPPGNCDVDYIGGLSRKRKSTAMDPRWTTSEYCFRQESNTQDASSRLGLNGQGNKHGVYLNQTKSVEPVNFGHQFNNDQPHYRNDFSEPRPTCNANFHRAGIAEISNASYSMPPQSLQNRGLLPLVNMPVGETLMVPNRQLQECYMLGQTEARRSLPFPNPHTEKSQVGPDLQALMRFGNKNYVVLDKMPPEICNTSFECLRSMEILQQSFVQPNRFSDGLNGRTCSQENSKSEISCALKQSGHCSNNARIGDFSTVGTASFGASVCTEQNENNRLLENEVQFGIAPLGICLGDASESKKQSHGDDDVKIKEIKTASDAEKSKYSLTEDISSKSGGSHDNIDGHGQKNDQSHGPLEVDDKSKLLSGKAASTVAEKLWDGSLQLNSSVTLSAVAFFKSGEKLLDINWSEYVEVKGKVRLEAFEKYIQDLPRSRNRGLMVISLCWKEGSSETGLTGMKEVAKGYRKGGRVGFAQLSPGVDVYICPRSDTIITILAKYGFFKGMAAIEDNQDSLIGCVVWRRNRTSSNSVAEKVDTKNNNLLSEQPLNSPSVSSTQQVAEKKLSPTQPPQHSNQSLPLVMDTSSANLENGTGNKNIESRRLQDEVGESSSDANTLLTLSVVSNSPSIPVAQQALTYSPLQGSHRNLLEAEASRTSCSVLEKPKVSLELQNPVISLPSNVMKQTMPTSDDDDLPEYDFGIACGISATPMSKPLGEAIKNNDRAVLPNIPVVQAMSFSNQRSDNSSLPRNPSAPNQGMPLPKKVCEHESQSKVTPTPVSVTAFPSPKNSFNELPKKNKLFDDDDDDMPEWCPPELHKQSLGGAIRPSTSLPLRNLNPTFQNIAPGPPRPPLPSPSSAFSYQTFRPAFHCPTTITVKVPQSMPFESGPKPSMGFNSNPVLRPQSSSFDVKLPFQPGDRRAWRP